MSTSPLLMLRLLPDMQRLARWAAAARQQALRDDAGYALHAALKATLGAAAPKPFALLERPGSLQLIGYTCATPAEIDRAIGLAPVSDHMASQALGLDRPADIVVKPMPADWRADEVMSFEVRIAPVVRSRQPDGTYPEVDAAFHSLFTDGTAGDRGAAYGRWLARELARGGAASLGPWRMLSQQLTPIARRARHAESSGRQTLGGLLPEITARGQLRIDDGDAFHTLLARGLGRHRSFGYGCLLLAPSGAWT